MSLSIQCEVKLVALLLLCCSVLSSSSAINLAVLVPPDPDIFRGVMAAQFEANKANAVPGHQLNATFYNIAGASVAELVALIGTISADPTTFGYLLPFFGVSDVLMNYSRLVQDVTHPIIGPISTSLTLPSSLRHVLNLRPPITSEIFQMLSYALHSRTHCTSFTVIASMIDNFQSFIDTIVGVFAAKTPYPTPLTILVASDVNASQLRNEFFNGSSYPYCVALFGSGAVVTTVIEALHEDPRFDHANTFFFALSNSDLGQFVSSAGSSVIFENLFITQLLPNPRDNSTALASTYQNAMAAYANSTNVSLTVADYNYFSFEAYVTTRMTIEVLRGMRVMTPSAFIDEVYTRTFVRVDDMVLGPLTDACPSSFQSFPCFCNTAVSVMFMSRVNTTTGRATGVDDDYSLGEFGLSTASKDLQSCLFDVSDINRPLNVIIFVDTNIPASLQNAVSDFALTSLTAALYANKNSLMDGLGRFRMVPLTTDTTNQHRVELLEARLVPLCVSGSNSYDYPVLNVFSNFTTMALKDPLIGSSFSRYKLELQAVLADHIHSLASFLSVQVNSSSPIVVVAESVEQAALAEKSLNTFQLAPSRIILFHDLGWPALLQSVLRPAASGGSSALLLAVMQDYATVVPFLNNISSLSTSSYNTGSVLAVACDDQFLWQYLADGYPAPSPSPFFATARPLVSVTVMQVMWALQNLAGSTFSIIDTSVARGLPSPSAIDGYLFSTLLYSQVRNTKVSLSTESVTDTIYASGSIANGDVSYGPFYDALCPASVIAAQMPLRSCQCTKGPRKFTVLNMTEYYLQLPSSQPFSYVHPGCGTLYLPLQPRLISPSNTAIFVYAAVSIVVFGLCLYFVARVVRSRRFAMFIKSGLWIVCLSVILSSGFIVLNVFAMLSVLFGGSAFTFIVVYIFVISMAIATGTSECFLKIRWIVARLTKEGEMPPEEAAEWEALFARASLIALGSEDLPTMVVTFAALMQQSATVPLLLTLIVTAYFAGDKKNMVQKGFSAAIRRALASLSRSPKSGLLDAKSMANPLAEDPLSPDDENSGDLSDHREFHGKPGLDSSSAVVMVGEADPVVELEKPSCDGSRVVEFES